MMLAHSLLSGALLLLPIAVTVGIYIGIEFQKIFYDGFDNSFGVPKAGPGGGGLSGGGNAFAPDPEDGIQTSMYCQKLVGITPKGSRYIYNPNQWGLSENEPSGLCMNVTTGLIDHSNDASNTYADPFSVTWNFTQGPESQPVRAFPNTLLEAPNMPLTISSITSIPVDVSWHYGLGDDNSTISTDAAMEAQNVNANVAFDMFLDTSKDASSVTTRASHEIMIWLGQLGPATQPIGFAKGSAATQAINGTTFNLYTGQNGNGQYVWTWVAADTTQRFVGDVRPLLTSLASQANAPVGADYLGYFGFGTEAYSSPTNVTFMVPELSIDIRDA